MPYSDQLRQENLSKISQTIQTSQGYFWSMTILTYHGTSLESCGFIVDSYGSPDIALEKFKPDYYDLLLLDVRMPGMTGFESL